MNEVGKRSNLLGLLILFAVYTALGVLLGFFYVIFQTRVHDVWGNVIAVAVFAGLLGGVAWIVKRLCKITNNAMAMILVAIGTAIVLYVVWTMWIVVIFELFYRSGENLGVGDIGFVLSEVRYMTFVNQEFVRFIRHFNDTGTWTIDGDVWYGAILWAVWGVETIVIAVIPIIAALSSAGLYIAEVGGWVDERLMNYGFVAFDDYELESIGAGDINAIIEKPLEIRNSTMNAVAVCYHKGEPTDYIAIYKAHWDKEGALSKGKHIMTVQLGAEKIDTLDAALQAKHFPSLAPKESPVPTMPVVAETGGEVQPQELQSQWEDSLPSLDNNVSDTTPDDAMRAVEEGEDE